MLVAFLFLLSHWWSGLYPSLFFTVEMFELVRALQLKFDARKKTMWLWWVEIQVDYETFLFQVVNMCMVTPACLAYFTVCVFVCVYIFWAGARWVSEKFWWIMEDCTGRQHATVALSKWSFEQISGISDFFLRILATGLR